MPFIRTLCRKHPVRADLRQQSWNIIYHPLVVFPRQWAVSFPQLHSVSHQPVNTKDRSACITYTFNYASSSMQGVGFLPFQFSARQTACCKKLDSWIMTASTIIYQESGRRIDTRIGCSIGTRFALRKRKPRLGGKQRRVYFQPQGTQVTN
jgi:hypothetical protein